MSIKPTFKLEDITNFITNSLKRQEQAVINAYKFAGEQFVVEARLKTAADGGFNDVTGNLRSSIGYIILVDGKSISEDFQNSGTGSDGSQGVVNGELYAEEVSREHPTGIVLICVAGMDYAAAVESKGRDVITGSSLEMQAKLNNLLKQI